MIKAIIFDLDQTIVNSSLAESERKNRNWKAVYRLIPSFHLYDGFLNVFKEINNSNIKVCIVTSSPGSYAKKVIEHFDIPCDYLVDYFATTKRKPDGMPMLKALELLNLEPKNVISFGDRSMDIISSKSSEIKSVACKWGSNEIDLLLKSSPDFIIEAPSEIIGLLKTITD